MRFFRVLFPFLFVRNWHTGAWELSSTRIMLFSAFLIFFGMAITIVIVLQAPVEYSSGI
jgi:hypothetical protein